MERMDDIASLPMNPYREDTFCVVDMSTYRAKTSIEKAGQAKSDKSSTSKSIEGNGKKRGRR